MNAERGAALIVAMMVLAFLTILGGSLLTTSTLDVRIGDNYRTNTQLLYLTEAALDQARETIRASANTASQQLATAAGADAALVNSISPDTLIASNDVPVLNNANYLDATGRLIGRAYVYLRNDARDGRTNLADTNRVVNLFAIGIIGNARKAIESDIKRGEFPPIPAALTLDGPIGTFNPANSNPHFVNGNDQAGAAPNVNGIGVISGGDDATVTAAIPANRLDHYLGAGYNPGPPPVPDVQNVSGVLHPSLTTVSGLEEIVDSIAGSANTAYNPAFGTAQAIGNVGTVANPQVVVVNGDASMTGNTTGYGILLVRGNLTLSGNFAWNGLMLVIGQGSIDWSGGGNGQMNGGIFIARTRANDRSAVNLLGTQLGARGAVSINISGGGGNGIYYNSTAIANAGKSFPWSPISYREY